MDFLGYSLGRLVHGFEDDSESSIDLTQELTDVPLFRWDFSFFLSFFLFIDQSNHYNDFQINEGYFGDHPLKYRQYFTS